MKGGDQQCILQKTNSNALHTFDSHQSRMRPVVLATDDVAQYGRLVTSPSAH